MSRSAKNQSQKNITRQSKFDLIQIKMVWKKYHPSIKMVAKKYHPSIKF